MSIPRIEDLIFVLDSIRDFKDHERKLNEALGTIVNGEGTITGGCRLISLIILLEALFEDKRGLINWYIVKNDLGRRNQSFEINGKEMKFNSDADLYYVLVQPL
jgi:hypothetical protein